MKIKKRDGQTVDFERQKIGRAMEKAFWSVGQRPTEEELEALALAIEARVRTDFPADHLITVEEVQDLVELTLLEAQHYPVVKAYILYRNQHHQDRQVLQAFAAYVQDPQVLDLLRQVQGAFDQGPYSLQALYRKFESFALAGMDQAQYLEILTRSANELTSKEAPQWEFIAGRFLNLSLEQAVAREEADRGWGSFYQKIQGLAQEGLYGSYILEAYGPEEVQELADLMDPARNELLNYSGLDLLIKRYLIRSFDGRPLERVQEMFLGIALHLALKEEDRVFWARRFYQILSQLQVTMATPTMGNARKPHHQLSSCFIDTVPDTLAGIYRSVSNFAQVSKYGGGMGLYFGKVRASGSDIRGFQGVAGGVIPWLKLANDTAVAVDQLGVRQGSVATYLDVWHQDLPEFLQIRTNSGDDRMKAHDVFPALAVPDYFWELARDAIDSDWHLLDPHQVLVQKGYALEDFYGEEWKERYLDLVADPQIHKRTLPVKELVRLIIKSWTETGTPFIFNRDVANRYNPNKHRGLIYASNLCTEIMQNTSPSRSLGQRLEEVAGQVRLVEEVEPGDFVVCNLASLVLGRLPLEDEAALEAIVETAVRALDNVIDLNYYPSPLAQVTNQRYRAIGLGVSGYHHLLVKEGIAWSDREEHLALADRVFEKINFYAIQASQKLAQEKGPYPYFEGSDWQTGEYFRLRNYSSPAWQELAQRVQEGGLRNGYLLAIAPTGSTSIIAGTSAGIDPIMNRYYLEEKQGSIVPRVAPDLGPETFWLYENAHEVDQLISVEACGVRGRHIDQGQSMNIYMTENFTMRQLLTLYIKAWEWEVKSIYYVRSKSLEVAECDYCQ